ncbi:MAG: L,D-transpeptidase [Planctomycetaceae bacterium]
MRAPVAALALVLLAAACGGQEVVVPSPSVTPAAAIVTAPVLASPSPAAEKDPHATIVVRAIGSAFRLYDGPGPGAERVGNLGATNDWGEAIALPVLARFTDVQGNAWLRVELPTRPNGSHAWIRADQVTTREVTGKIVVDLSRHSLTRYDDGTRVAHYRVAIGSPTFPTSTGDFFVWAKVPYTDTAGPYGVFALGLSGFSDVITDWPGGGRMAIHGTANPADRGQAVSHGCVRVYNPEMRTLEDVSMGTPVLIHP